jgi:hypothetical protein
MEPSATNPTGEFEPRPFDNVYLDMNGILHNSAFGVIEIENASNQMQENFVAKLETIFAAVRPTKLLFMALDGVAPRAKMNQQRTRRFMSRLTHGASKKNAKPTVYINKPYHDSSSRDVASMLPEDIIIKDQSTMPTFDFDSNCVTPGTDFMVMAANWLHSFAQAKLKSGVWGEEIVIVVSDTSVPGEGEHKIIDWIRQQKPMADRSHCIYGADADLIFLGLALHDPSVHILREGTMPKVKTSTTSRSGKFRGKASRDTIFVSELHPMTTELELGQLFEPCGPIASVRIIAEGHTKSNNFGFVRFGRVSASSGTLDGELTEEEGLEVDRSVARALLMNGHKLRGKSIGIDSARGTTQSPLTEAQQLKILEQQELLTVEFMSIMGIEDSAMALAILNLTNWKMEEAQVMYLEFASSGIPWDSFIGSRSIDLASKASMASKSPSRTPTFPASPMSPSSSRDAAFSPMSPSESIIPSEDAEKDADKDEEPDEEEVLGLNSPYILVDLSTLKSCFSDKFSRVSISASTGEVIDTEAIQHVPYTRLPPSSAAPNVPSSSNDASTPPPIFSVTIERPAPVPATEILFRSFEVEKVLDDFVLLGMLFGNDFLPGLPTQDIKTGSFNRLLQEYETPLVTDGFLCTFENFHFERLAKVLDLVAVREKDAIRKKIIATRKYAIQQQKKKERAEKKKEMQTPSDTPSEDAPSVLLAPLSEMPSPSSSVPVTPLSESPAPPEADNTVSPQKRPFQPRRRRGSKEPLETDPTASPISFGSSPLTPIAGRARYAGPYRDLIPEPTEADHLARRAQYYVDNFPEIDWSPFLTDEEKIEHAKRTICVEYLRGISWVMRYYFCGCPSWEWYFPHHYAPFAVDIAAQLRAMAAKENKVFSNDHFQFTLGRPLRPLEQLVAVLPAESIMILPSPLRTLVTDPSSLLAPYFPTTLNIQKSDGVSGAVAKWHGVLRLPFIPRETLIAAVQSILPKLDLTDLARNQFCQNVAYFHNSHPLYDVCLSLPTQTPSKVENSSSSSAPSSASSSSNSHQEQLDAQQIIDSLFMMPMKNVSQSPLSGKAYVTLLFDLIPL